MKTQYKIAMSGLPGAGKDGLIKRLSEYYQIPKLSIGTLRREFAVNELGMTIDEMNERRLNDKTLDTQFDEFQARYMKENEKWIIEGRLPYYFAPPEAIKLFLAVDKHEAAKRIFSADRESEKNYKNEKEVLETLEQRMKSDKDAYWDLYKTNCYDVTNFDIILDTTYRTQEEVFRKAIQRITLLSLSKY
ncbi:AAA family ATPase [archaeon]|nr:AAA family ATPase [archaeon]